MTESGTGSKRRTERTYECIGSGRYADMGSAHCAFIKKNMPAYAVRQNDGSGFNVHNRRTSIENERRRTPKIFCASHPFLHKTNANV